MTTHPSYKRHFYIPTGNVVPGSNLQDSSSRSIFGQLENRRRLISEMNIAKSAGDTVGVKMIEAELGITDTTRPKEDESRKMVHDMLNTIKARLLDPNLSANEAFNMYSKLATLEKVLSGEKVDLGTISSLNAQAPASPAPLTMISQTSELYNFINSIEKRVEEKMTKFAPEDPLEKVKRDAEFFKMLGWLPPGEASKVNNDSIELKKIDNEFELAKMKLDSEGKKYTGIKEIITDVITAVAEESAGDEFTDKKEKKVMRSNRPSFNCLGDKCGQRVEFSHPEASRDITCPACNTKHHYDHTKKDNQITLA